MKTETRNQILALIRQAGMADLRVAEIEGGCTAERCVRILIGQLDRDSSGSGLTLSDPRSAVQALDLAYQAKIEQVTCDFCKTTLPREEAIEEGWLPSYYRGGQEVSEPVCCDCQGSHLRMGEDGEAEVIA